MNRDRVSQKNWRVRETENVGAHHTRLDLDAAVFVTTAECAALRSEAVAPAQRAIETSTAIQAQRRALATAEQAGAP